MDQTGLRRDTRLPERPRTLVVAGLAVLAAVLAAPAMSGTPLGPGESDALSERPRDCPQRIDKARFRDGKEVVFAGGDLIDLTCGYNLSRGKGKGISVLAIRLRYHIGEHLPPHGDDPRAEPYCWRARSAGSATADADDDGPLSPLEASLGAPETITNNGFAGVIYPVGDRFIWARYSASTKPLVKRARKAVIELAANLANEPTVGIATCPFADPPIEAPSPGEPDSSAQVYAAAMDRYIARVAAATEMEDAAIGAGDPLAVGDALGAAYRAHVAAAEDFAAELETLPLPPDLEAEVDALAKRVLEEAALWHIIATDGDPTGQAEPDPDAVFAAADELVHVTAARESADAELRELLGLG